jgi:hypothetical protein
MAATAAAVTLVVAVAGGACADDEPDPVAPGPTSTAVSTTGATAPTSVPAGAGQETTVRGTVAAVSASARVLDLEAPVDGYTDVALSSDTEYRKADGSPGALQDVAVGSTVEVTGVPGAPGALLARRVVVVG